MFGHLVRFHKSKFSEITLEDKTCLNGLKMHSKRLRNVLKVNSGLTKY